MVVKQQGEGMGGGGGLNQYKSIPRDKKLTHGR